MRNPIRWDLYGDRRLNLEEDIPLVGRDFTGATFASQVRLTPDAPGSPLITPTVSLTYGGTDTVANHVSAGRISDAIYEVDRIPGVKYVSTDMIALSVIHVHVDNGSMISPYVPAASETGDDVTLAWDMLITPSGAAADKWFYGDFIVRGIVTNV
jgi:hypothetical protein